MGINVAIDGPSGAGKSTLSKELAKKLGYIYVDTGALYRTVGLAVLNAKVDYSDVKSVQSLLPEIQVDLKYIGKDQHVYLDGADVSDQIRLHEVSEYASKVSAIPAVRAYLFEMQQKLARENDIVMDGRDIGTVVLPNADVKIFLTASAEVRAKRRYNELIERGQEVAYEQVLADVVARDYQDMNREIAPLRPAEDSITVDTSELTFEESLDLLFKTITENLK